MATYKGPVHEAVGEAAKKLVVNLKKGRRATNSTSSLRGATAKNQASYAADKAKVMKQGWRQVGGKWINVKSAAYKAYLASKVRKSAAGRSNVKSRLSRAEGTSMAKPAPKPKAKPKAKIPTPRRPKVRPAVRAARMQRRANKAVKRKVARKAARRPSTPAVKRAV